MKLHEFQCVWYVNADCTDAEREKGNVRDNSEGVFFIAPPIIAHQVAYLSLSI